MPRRFICAFCAHLDVVQFSRVLQQQQLQTAPRLRTLHSSAKVARPPGAAAAELSNEDDEHVTPVFRNGHAVHPPGRGFVGTTSSLDNSLLENQLRQRSAVQARSQFPGQRSSSFPSAVPPSQSKFSSAFTAPVDVTLLTEDEARQRRVLMQRAQERTEAQERLRQESRNEARESQRSIRKQLLVRPVSTGKSRRPGDDSQTTGDTAGVPISRHFVDLPSAPWANSSQGENGLQQDSTRANRPASLSDSGPRPAFRRSGGLPSHYSQQRSSQPRASQTRPAQDGEGYDRSTNRGLRNDQPGSNTLDRFSSFRASSPSPTQPRRGAEPWAGPGFARNPFDELGSTADFRRREQDRYPMNSRTSQAAPDRRSPFDRSFGRSTQNWQQRESRPKPFQEREGTDRQPDQGLANIGAERSTLGQHDPFRNASALPSHFGRQQPWTDRDSMRSPFDKYGNTSESRRSDEDRDFGSRMASQDIPQRRPPFDRSSGSDAPNWQQRQTQPWSNGYRADNSRQEGQVLGSFRTGQTEPYRRSPFQRSPEPSDFWQRDESWAGQGAATKAFQEERGAAKVNTGDVSSGEISLPSFLDRQVTETSDEPESGLEGTTASKDLGRGSGRFADDTSLEDLRQSRKSQKPTKNTRRRLEDELAGDFDEDSPGGRKKLAERRRKRREEAALRKRAAAPPPIHLPGFISVAGLASLLKVKLNEFTEKLKELGFENRNHDFIFNAETAGLIVSEYRYEPVYEKDASNDLQALPEPEDKSNLPFRPPVVTIMGHVDHGKTTLLDYLRQSSIAASEHGGITQHIGAFSVRMSSGKLITFLDTPGHEAFLNMRQRGARVTDIVILVVAADDSVKPQTIEAIKHAKSAKVPMIVAINKVDKPEANVERVKQDLATNGVELEDVGGDTQAICVSGKTGQGMNDLEDATVLLSEILDIRADPEGRCEGWVIESATRKTGRMTSILVRRGTLRPGHVLVAGSTWARARTLKNEAGIEVESASPGMAVEVDGWKEVPAAGAEVLQCQDEGQAKSVVELRTEREEMTKMASDVEVVNKLRQKQHIVHGEEKRAADDLYRQRRAWRMSNKFIPKEMPKSSAQDPAADTEPKSRTVEVLFVVKCDVGGSVEAVVDSISSLGNDMVRPKILRTGAGNVTESDVEMAAAAKGTIIAFSTPKIDPGIARLADMMRVPILEHNIIYHLTDAVKARLTEELPDIESYRVTGEAEVGQVFNINIKRKVTKTIAGCRVRNGLIARNAKVRVLRDKEIIYDGQIESLKNIKKDVMEMRKGTECGMAFEGGWADFRVGDQVQCYEVLYEKRTL